MKNVPVVSSTGRLLFQGPEPLDHFVEKRCPFSLTFPLVKLISSQIKEYLSCSTHLSTVIPPPCEHKEPVGSEAWGVNHSSCSAGSAEL